MCFSLLKKLVAHHNRVYTDVHGAMVDLSKPYIKTNLNSLCDKLGAKYLPGQIVNLNDFLGKNAFACSSFRGCLSDEWKISNGVRRGWGSHLESFLSFTLIRF